MNNGRSNLDELMDVLEGIRKEKYPDVPADIIRQIAVIQYENQDKRAEARTVTHNLVNTFLAEMAHEEENSNASLYQDDD